MEVPRPLSLAFGRGPQCDDIEYKPQLSADQALLDRHRFTGTNKRLTLGLSIINQSVGNRHCHVPGLTPPYRGYILV